MTSYHPLVLDRWLSASEQAHDAPACRDSRVTLNHQEVSDLAHRRARLLVSRGLRVEDRVVVLLGTGTDQAVWIAAVMLAGGCAVPVGLHQPEHRLRALVELASPAAVITDAATRSLADGFVSHDGSHPGEEGTAALPATDRDRAAYICFTSGTTGRPKGVVVPHGVLAHTSGEMAAYLGLADRPRTHVLTTSWSFDVAMMDLWLALTTGGTLYVPDRDDLLGPALVGTVADIRAPIVHGVPSLFGAFSDSDFRRLPEHTTVMLGGESVPASMLRNLSDHTDMHAVYGITETGVITTTHRVTPSTTPEIIGRALPGVDCVVVGKDGTPLPDGEQGELLIGGPVVAREYLDDPAGTAARFVVDKAGVRRYRTGDLVRRDANGVLSFHGRIDQQLKIRGHRLEPSEIEQVLLGLPGVRQAAVVARANPAGELAVVAYLVGTGLRADEVGRELATRMPDWMRPSAIELLPSLPVSVTGKVDRQLLPEPRWPAGTDTGASDTDDRTETERVIGGMWNQLLGTRQAGAGDNFVALGGHSLKAAQLSTALRDRLGVSIPVSDVLSADTLRTLAELVDSAVGQDPESTELSGPRADGPSPVQRQLWLHQELAGTDGIYNLVVGVRLRGPLQTVALQRALHSVERRHPALLTTFHFDGVDLTTVRQSPGARPLAVSTVDPAEAVRRAGARAIDVSRELPWRYQLINTGEKEHLLLLTFHHISVDGVAIYRLLEEIAQRYSAFVEPARASRAGSLTSDARTSTARPAVGEEAADRAFWAAMMGDAPEPTALPGQRTATDLADFAGWCRPVELAGTEPDGLRRAAAAHGVTPQSLLLAAFVRTLARQTGTLDVTVGVPVSRRGTDTGFAAIGQYVSVLPVRFRLPAGLAPASCLAAVARTMSEVQRHGALDPAVILEAARSGQGRSAGDPFRVVFAWEDELPAPEFAGLESFWDLEFNGWSESDLTVELADRGHTVAGRIVGRQATSTDVDVPGLMRALVENIREIVDN
ncbi:AMP-binding protein [Streptomyces sp. AK08-02]|uniref:AMP-binding protein n=1 Tax=Streptomyces sp. AK08-02 TaxID=3028654 RepID=UPI0029AA1668|nr:AMP-binding protein [Streptomyces sp. AK08-02]MDX3752851.1 AMP-binding protein [Streptomyces sp. AK08-02]